MWLGLHIELTSGRLLAADRPFGSAMVVHLKLFKIFRTTFDLMPWCVTTSGHECVFCFTLYLRSCVPVSGPTQI